MENILFYLLKSALCFMVLFIPFQWILRKQEFVVLNRFLLLFTLVSSMVFPLVYHEMPDYISQFFAEEEKTASVVENNLPNINLDIENSTSVEAAPGFFESITIAEVLFCLWIVGAMGVFVWQIVSYIQLFVLLHSKRSRKIKNQLGNSIYLFAQDIPSMSWMKCVLLSEDDYLNHKNEILAHEYAHIAKGHSWDRLLMSLCQIVQWFNPFVWICSDTLSEIHEYEADRTVLNTGINIKQYQYLLISKAAGPATIAMVNRFNHSQLKSRIIMMNRTTSNPLSRARYLVVLPMLFLAFIVSAQEKKKDSDVKVVGFAITSSPTDDDSPLYILGDEIIENSNVINIKAISGSEMFRKNATKPGTDEVFAKIKDKYPNKNTVIVLQVKPGMDPYAKQNVEVSILDDNIKIRTKNNQPEEMPLCLVDGKKVDMSDIDPKTIESVEVFKDNGSNKELFDKYLDKYPEAANGIIMIKLKPAENDVVYHVTVSYDNEKAEVPGRYSIAVFDEDNEPIVGAIVRLKGTKQGVVTDGNGTCKINATSGQTLSVMFVGFESQEVTLTGNLATSVVLKKE